MAILDHTPTDMPTTNRPINMGASDQWKPWLVRDQRFVSSRPDVLNYVASIFARGDVKKK